LQSAVATSPSIAASAAVSGRDDETAAGSNANPRMLAMAGAAADTPLDAVSARLITTAGRQHWPTVIMATIEPSAVRGARAAAGPHQLDSTVGAGFWLYEVCMYVYGKS
jgi:hypothetical protein